MHVVSWCPVEAWSRCFNRRQEMGVISKFKYVVIYEMYLGPQTRLWGALCSLARSESCFCPPIAPVWETRSHDWRVPKWQCWMLFSTLSNGDHAGDTVADMAAHWGDWEQRHALSSLSSSLRGFCWSRRFTWPDSKRRRSSIWRGFWRSYIPITFHTHHHASYCDFGQWAFKYL